MSGTWMKYRSTLRRSEHANKALRESLAACLSFKTAWLIDHEELSNRIRLGTVKQVLPRIRRHCVIARFTDRGAPLSALVVFEGAARARCFRASRPRSPWENCATDAESDGGRYLACRLTERLSHRRHTRILTICTSSCRTFSARIPPRFLLPEGYMSFASESRSLRHCPPSRCN